MVVHIGFVLHWFMIDLNRELPRFYIDVHRLTKSQWQSLESSFGAQ
jgi:hypothetical protein